MSTTTEIVRVPQVEREYGIPAATLRWYRHVGRGPKSFKIGRRIAYRREDVEAWIQGEMDRTAVGGTEANGSAS